MAKYVNSGNSIECQGSRVAVRKISKPQYIKIEDKNGIVVSLYKYKSKIRAIVTIVEELNPKECLICHESFLDLNDELEGDTIEIYTKNRAAFELVSNFSHVHGIQGNVFNFFTYAKIVIPWQFVLQRQLTAG